MAIGTLQFYA